MGNGRKIKKKKASGLNNTLDAEHKKYIDHFDSQKKLLPKRKKELTKLEKEFEKLDQLLDHECTNEQIQRRYTLEHKIATLKREIKNTEKDRGRIDYFFKTSNVMSEYLENQELEQNEKQHQSIDIVYSDNDSDDQFEEDNNDGHLCTHNGSFKSQTNTNKQMLKNKFLMLVDKHFYGPIQQQSDIWICEHCKAEKVLFQNESKLVCTNCCIPNDIIIDSEKPSFKEPMQDNSYFHYKRINHFKEWIYKFQAKESTEIKKEVYDAIKKEIVKRRLTDISQLDNKKMKNILKSIGYSKYYDHVPHIINKLYGNKIPGRTVHKLTREQEDKMCAIFMEVHNIFEEVCPRNRTNFLSYSYVLYKICELLELDKFLPCFNLLKNPEKLHDQDRIWKHICEKLKYQYFPSI